MSAAPSVLDARLALDARALVGEGPVWDGDALLWVDIDAGAVHRFDPTDGTDRSDVVGTDVGAIALRESGGYVLAMQRGFYSWRDRVVEPIALPYDDPELRMNDGKVDPAGRFWAGSMARDERSQAGILYRLDLDLRVQAMVDGVTISNGMDWTDDGRTMCFIDSPAGTVDRFDYEIGSGSISNRRPIISTPEDLGVPDGMALDAEGCLWVAIWGAGQVRRYSPEGEYLGWWTCRRRTRRAARSVERASTPCHHDRGRRGAR